MVIFPDPWAVLFAASEGQVTVGLLADVITEQLVVTMDTENNNL